MRLFRRKNRNIEWTEPRSIWIEQGTFHMLSGVTHKFYGGLCLEFGCSSDLIGAAFTTEDGFTLTIANGEIWDGDDSEHFLCGSLKDGKISLPYDMSRSLLTQGVRQIQGVRSATDVVLRIPAKT